MTPGDIPHLAGRLRRVRGVHPNRNWSQLGRIVSDCFGRYSAGEPPGRDVILRECSGSPVCEPVAANGKELLSDALGDSM